MKVEVALFKELYLNIASDRFHFLKFILEGYDGLAVLSSIDGKAGIIRLLYPSESEGLLFELMTNLSKKISRYS
jgi:hypothetical protein